MEEFNKKLKGFIGIGVWILSVLFLISTIRNIGKVVNIRKQVQIEKEKVKKMQADNSELQAQIDEAQSLAFIEKQIRNDLGMVKSGEAIVVLPDQAVVKSFAPPESFGESSLPDPNWKKWLKLFI